jgi:hypothetical protein
MAKKVEIDVQAKGILEIRKELRDMRSELLAATDPKEVERLTIATAELEDSLVDINEQVAIFKTGSKFEATTNSLKAVGSGLASLDFEKAAARAQAFAVAAGRITFKDAIGSVKDLGKTMLTIGKAILTNPLFLIGALVALIVKAIIDFMDELGLLKKIIETLTAPLRWLSDGLKSLTDWLGWTSNAAEEAADKTAESFAKMADAQELNGQRITQGLDNQIRLLKLEGKETTDLERAKQIELIKTAKLREKADEAALKALKLKKNADEQEIADLEKKLKLSKLASEQAFADLEFFDKRIAKEKSDAREKELKDEADKNDKLKSQREQDYKNRLAQQKEYNALRLQTARQLEDLETELLEDEQQKALRQNQLKYQRLIEDVTNNEKLLQSERDKLIEQFQLLQTENEKELITKAEAEKTKLRLDAQQELNQLLIESSGNRFLIEKSQIEQQATETLALLSQQLEQGLITKEQYDQAEISLERQKKEQLDLLKAGPDGETNPIIAAQNAAQQLLEIERQKFEAGLIDEQEFADRKLAIEEDLAEKIEKINQDLNSALISTRQAQLAEVGASVQSLGNLIQSVNEAEIAQAEGNEAKQEQLRRKGFESGKKMQIANATIAGVQGVINALTAQSVVPEPMGSILKGVNAAIVGATTIANIAKIKSTQYSGGGGGAPVQPSASAASAARSMPSITFMPPGQSQNQISQQPATEQGGQSITVNAIVSETEMTATQSRVNNMITNSEL